MKVFLNAFFCKMSCIAIAKFMFVKKYIKCCLLKVVVNWGHPVLWTLIVCTSWWSPR